LVPEAKVPAETVEVGVSERLCEDVRNVITGADPSDGEFVVRHEVPHGMVFDADVLHLRMPDIIFCKAARGVVIAVKGGGVMLRNAYAI